MFYDTSYLQAIYNFNAQFAVTVLFKTMVSTSQNTNRYKKQLRYLSTCLTNLHFIKHKYKGAAHTLHYVGVRTCDMCRSAYVIIMVADVLVLNRLELPSWRLDYAYSVLLTYHTACISRYNHSTNHVPERSGDWHPVGLFSAVGLAF